MGRHGERGHEGLGREARVRLQRKGTGSRCKRDLFLLVCRVKAAIRRLGNWVLMCSSQHPNTYWPLIYLSSRHLLWEHSAVILILQMSSRGKRIHLRGLAAPHPSPTATLVQVCWGMAGAESYHPWTEVREVRGAEHTTWWARQPSNSLEHPANILGFRRTKVLLRC